MDISANKGADKGRTPDEEVGAFIERWRPSEGGEHRTYQMFLTELTTLLGVDKPGTVGEDYVFERRVTTTHLDGSTSGGRIDLYKRGCFVLEAKQGVFKPGPEATETDRDKPRGKPRSKGHGVRDSKQWNDAMMRARAQAKRYADSLPLEDPIPPFLIVVDVGYSFELFADFTGTGRHYTQFPDTRSFRFKLDDLAGEMFRERLRRVWTDPSALDPSLHAAKVTRGIADKLGRLAKSLEREHGPKAVSDFLMRCLFTMFAEDVRLLKDHAFTDLLTRLRDRPDALRQMVGALWRDMNGGTPFSPVIEDAVPHFNGALFANAEALSLSTEQIDLLIEAAKADWRDVEPAIFGTLLERALDKDERHRLGAHYTPRAYVERLVLPTIIEPLRADWEDVKVAALASANAGELDKAVDVVRDFHRRLCEIKVLDPACGSGNFLYVTLEHMKRLEGEVLDLLVTELGERQESLDLSGHTVDPHQFLGLEKNERAVPIAEMVLWIGHLQWYVRSQPTFTAWPKPILKRYGNIRVADALLSWRDIALERDDQGRPLARWDGVSLKSDPITGAQVPDESKRVERQRYIAPRVADWPQADFIIGNPPFIGGKDLRQELGDGYAEALWAVYGKQVPNAADFVMYWWHRAAEKVRTGHTRRFGFITTNSLTQTFNRRVVEAHMKGRHPIGLLQAIPDHPWVKALNEDKEEAVRDAAQVRVAMTVGARDITEGRLLTVVTERPGQGDSADVVLRSRRGSLNADLTIGADTGSTHALASNEGLASRGIALHGAGFIVTPDQARDLGLGRIPGLEDHILPYRNGRDLAAKPRGVMVIDLFGLEEQQVRSRFPEVYQWINERVKPEREHNNRASYRDYWWIFGEPRREFRPAVKDLPRYIASVETARHRTFQFLDHSIRPDNKLVAIATADAYHLGVLSSRVHITWALAVGGRLGVGNDPVYVKSSCFDKFPFPDCPAPRRDAIRALAEELDALRKRQLAAHPDLTLTGMYNVLVKLRAGVPLEDKDRAINDRGLVSTLMQLHDEIDGAVTAAYGWPGDDTDDTLLARLVALNADRHREERTGRIRYLRPDFQRSRGRAVAPSQSRLAVENAPAAPSASAKTPWPKSLPDQVQAIRILLPELGPQASVEAIATRFKGARRDRVAEIVQAMAVMG
ncbi:MAG: class I SAM-dependent DNA methyltransferase [Rhodospirillum sp.]|nr:class I SAM-dependent DNA methyltransferase [Rhodospirillum sp.]MCF8490337.1 class I SAM-dependent DNA methyltransferase [Rhodospirillum sp.]MCF8501819.1 class I SAM-dependent DNA methyltransferase [Rhodospirillum sp.]